MERLTKSGVVSQKDINELMELSNENQFGQNDAYYKLKYYEDLEEQGRIVYLPCKVGTPVYTVAEDCGGDIFDCMRGEYGECEDCDYLYSFVEQNAFDTYMVNEVGKTIFLTKEEAEKKLADMQKGQI